MKPVSVLGVLLAVSGLLHPASGMAAEDPCTVPPEDRPPQVEPVVACGTTTVSGTGGGTVRLTLPEEAVLDVASLSSKFKKVGLTGSGPMIGFYLSDNKLWGTEGGRFVRALYLGPGYYGDVRAWGTSEGFERAGASQGYVIPAGTYSLYLLSDGATVTATLPFEGRPGGVAVTATRQVASSLAPLSNRMADPGGTGQQNVVSMGVSADLGDAGGEVIVSAARQWGLPPLNETGSVCMYEFVPSDEDTAYLPGCPASYFDNGNGAEYPGYPANGGSMLSNGGRGGQALGFWDETATPGSPMAAVGAWFRFDTSYPE